MKHLAVLILSSFATACTANAVEQTASTPKLTIEQLIDIKHPSNAMWSPDGKRVAFIWDRAGISNLYVADTTAGETPKALTTYQAGTIGNAFWATDSSKVFFARGGDLWYVAASGGTPAAAWTTTTPESNIAVSPDGGRAAFVRAGLDLVVRSMADGKETKVAHDDQSIGGVSWSPDGMHLAYSAGAESIRHEQTPDYSGAKIIYTITERTQGQTFVVASSGGKPLAIGTPGGGGVRWLDAKRVVFDRTSADVKKRTNYVADIASGATRVAREDTDEKFWSITGDAGAAALPSSDGKWIAVVSDRDGWDHIYVMPAAGGEAVQITKGKFEAVAPIVVARQHEDRV